MVIRADLDRRLYHSGLLSVVALVFWWTSALAAETTLDFPTVSNDQVPYGYILDKAKWSNKYLSPITLTVCWENPSDTFSVQMEMVRDAVTDSWQAKSALSFRGWGTKCGRDGANIRIRIADVGPYTKGLGLQIDGIPDGMTLNFTYKAWGQLCQAAERYGSCIRSIAVHEFGHALGFAHEQNRPDTPGECSQPAQGGNGDIMLTPWDPESVMNYCNPVYNNNGILSQADLQSVHRVYGRRDAP